MRICEDVMTRLHTINEFLLARPQICTAQSNGKQVVSSTTTDKNDRFAPFFNRPPLIYRRQGDCPEDADADVACGAWQLFLQLESARILSQPNPLQIAFKRPNKIANCIRWKCSLPAINWN